MLSRLSLLTATLLLCICQPASAERRVALVVGNNNYKHMRLLENAKRDATQVAQTLRKLEFEVIVGFDLDKAETESIFKNFTRSADGADVVLFYYSGHAIQFDGKNYILPILANVEREPDLHTDTMAISDIISIMNSTSAKIHLIFLDACRDNPFVASPSEKNRSAQSMNITRGLARIPNHLGWLMAFSTAEDGVAIDGPKGGLSPFTDAFLPKPDAQGREVEAIFVAEPPDSGERKLRIRIDMHECDGLAGAILDFQGVSKGVLPENIDIPKARPACEKAVNEYPHIGRFHFQLARVRLAESRHAEALALYQQGVKLGHIRSHVGLGYMHAFCLGVPHDYARARLEYEKAADKGDPSGKNALGKLYYDGRGMQPNFDKARKLFEEAARVGQTSAMNGLARMYLLGEGVVKNEATARRHIENSTARGDMYGIHNLGFVYQDGIAGERDLEKAIAQFQKASDAGHPEAPNNIGNLMYEGKAIKQNYPGAAQWYKLGAERGDGWAALNYANMLRSGNGVILFQDRVEADLAEAAIFYARAAAFNNIKTAAQGISALKDMPQAAKIEALRRISGQLNSRSPQSDSENAIVSRAAKFLKDRSIFFDRSNFDDILVKLAETKWNISKARCDLF